MSEEEVGESPDIANKLKIQEVLLSDETDYVVLYDERYQRDGRAVIYYEEATLIVTYLHGKKNGESYMIFDNELVTIVEFCDDNIVSCIDVTKEESTVINTEKNLKFIGNVMNEIPMGYGECVDTVTNSMIYKGIMIGWMKMGFGTSFKDNKKIYQGDFVDDKRWGAGMLFDDRETIFRSGYWYNDEYKPSQLFCAELVGSLLDSIVINSTNNAEVLNLTGFQVVKDIRVKKGSLETVNEVSVSNLQNLRFLHFEDCCCTMMGNTRPDRHFLVSDCPLLESIEIGKYCFSDYSRFELRCLDSLKSLDIGNFGTFSFNFYGASFTLQDLPMLRSVKLGSNAFIYSLNTVFKNLPSLESIMLDEYALQGIDVDNCSLVMEDLPELKEITSTGYSFWYVRVVSFSNMPNVVKVELPFSFRHILSESYTNVSGSLELAVLYVCSIPDFSEANSSKENHCLQLSQQTQTMITT